MVSEYIQIHPGGRGYGREREDACAVMRVDG
jgi:hypothetical protein